jgi:hypothetical protein
VDDQTSKERDPLTALIDQLEWFRLFGLIDEYHLPPSGDVGEVVISEPAAQLVRDGRQPVFERGFQEAVRSGPMAARRWLAQEAEISRRRRTADPP